MKIREANRPLYYVSSSFSPELREDYSNWNNTTEFIPDMQEWIWDQLNYYIRHNIKMKNIDSEKGNRMISTFKTARIYNETCKGHSTVDTVVTHLYVCELLLEVLAMLFGNDWSCGHGYEFKDDLSKDAKDIFISPINFKSNGLAHVIHKLFYKNPLEVKENLTIKDYLIFCPELRTFMFESEKMMPKVIACYNEDYGATGAHTKEENYHCISFNMRDYFAITKPSESYNAEEEHGKNFPELKDYNISNKWASFSVEDETSSDRFISITRDPDGNTYALGFGQSPVQKQRDIEIRFGIIFVLGSLGRYRPWIWGKVEEENPRQYYAIKKFLGYNHLLFPYLILGYLSGKYFTFLKMAVLG